MLQQSHNAKWSSERIVASISWQGDASSDGSATCRACAPESTARPLLAAGNNTDLSVSCCNRHRHQRLGRDVSRQRWPVVAGYHADRRIFAARRGPILEPDLTGRIYAVRRKPGRTATVAHSYMRPRRDVRRRGRSR